MKKREVKYYRVPSITDSRWNTYIRATHNTMLDFKVCTNLLGKITGVFNLEKTHTFFIPMNREENITKKEFDKVFKKVLTFIKK